MKKVVFVISLIVLVGCATVTTLQPKEADLYHMQQKVAGISLEQAQAGFRLYKSNCSGCHSLFKPNAYTVDGWRKVLPEMLGRAKMTSEKDTHLLQNYLFAKSK